MGPCQAAAADPVAIPIGGTDEWQKAARHWLTNVCAVSRFVGRRDTGAAAIRHEGLFWLPNWRTKSDGLMAMQSVLSIYANAAVAAGAIRFISMRRKKPVSCPISVRCQRMR